MWGGLIPGCVRSCYRWPQGIPRKQRNLQSWVCCNWPSGSRSRFLQGTHLQVSLQTWSTEAAAEINTQGHDFTSSETSRKQDQQCSYPSREVHFLSEIHKNMEQLLKRESSGFKRTSSDAAQVKAGLIPTKRTAFSTPQSHNSDVLGGIILCLGLSKELGVEQHPWPLLTGF